MGLNCIPPLAVSFIDIFQNKRGELLLSLCYMPIEGLLTVEIVKGRNMKSMDLNGTSGRVFAWFVCYYYVIPYWFKKAIVNCLLMINAIALVRN